MVINIKVGDSPFAPSVDYFPLCGHKEYPTTNICESFNNNCLEPILTQKLFFIPCPRHISFFPHRMLDLDLDYYYTIAPSEEYDVRLLSEDLL